MKNRGLRVAFIIMTSILFLFCSGPQRAPEKPCLEPIVSDSLKKVMEPSSYLIYDQIAKEFGGNQYVLGKITVQWASGIDSIDKKSFTYLQKKIPSIDTSILNHLLTKTAPQVLDTSRMSSKKWIFIRMCALDSMFSFQKSWGNRNGWDEFYRLYPNAYGTMELSSIVYSSDKMHALVYGGNQTHWLSGAGIYFYLENKDGVWVVIYSVMVWIS